MEYPYLDEKVLRKLRRMPFRWHIVGFVPRMRYAWQERFGQHWYVYLGSCPDGSPLHFVMWQKRQPSPTTPHLGPMTYKHAIQTNLFINTLLREYNQFYGIGLDED